jgi:excisionase family DNA binding protein
VQTSAASDPGHRESAGDQLLTVNEVAVLLRVSKMTVYRLVHHGVLRACQIGRSFRFDPTDLTEPLTTVGLDSHGPTWIAP